MRNVVGVDGDQADCALALDRAEPLDDGAGGQAEFALPRDIHRDEIAVGGARGRAGRDAELAAELLLVDRHQPPAARRQAPENAERAMLGAIDQLDDAAGEFIVAGALDADQRAIADAAGFTRLRPARRDDVDDRRRAMRLLVPFGRPRQEFAVEVAAGNVGEHDGRQRAGVMQPLPAAVDAAFVGELAQHAVERGAVGVLGAEGLGDLARRDLAAALADEGDQFIAGGKAFA